MRERRMHTDILSDDDGDDPILSVVNIVDVFLVIIAVLLIAVIENPLNPFATQDAVVIRNPGKPDMSMLVKQGNELKEYRSSGQIGEGEGAKAGTAYRLKNGTMVYVPEDDAAASDGAGPGGVAPAVKADGARGNVYNRRSSGR
ncbi:MAG: DUF2149 domain-containing protein [Burkholderiaceae bacterium]|nr:DUF2149 domain-containing protein [Burkholderiaceae bacterium]